MQAVRVVEVVVEGARRVDVIDVNDSDMDEPAPEPDERDDDDERCCCLACAAIAREGIAPAAAAGHAASSSPCRVWRHGSSRGQEEEYTAARLASRARILAGASVRHLD